VPLEGSSQTTKPVSALLEQFVEPQPELLMLHVFDEEDMPPFANHEPHETDAWVYEFRQEYAPTRANGQVVMRVGRSDQVVGAVAAEFGTDVIVLSWSQDLSGGRARVVKAALGHFPTLLVPVGSVRELSARRASSAA
jgi:hypothetical protein